MESEPKMVSQFLLGSILLGISVLLVVPCAVGLVEYSSQAKTAEPDGSKKATAKRLKVYEIIQIIVLAFACAGFIFGFYVMATSDGGIGTKKGPLFVKDTAISPASSAVKTRTGGISRTKNMPLTAFEIL